MVADENWALKRFRMVIYRLSLDDFADWSLHLSGKANIWPEWCLGHAGYMRGKERLQKDRLEEVV